MRPSTSTSLLDSLAQVPDFRRRQGKRFPLPQLLTMIVMAVLSGHYGYREIARFLKANEEALREHLHLPLQRRMPSHVTIRTVLMKLDFEALRDAFEAWAAQRLRVAPGDWVAIDAKAIRSTVSDYDSTYQDFVCLVSAFACQPGAVLAQRTYQNKQTSEISATRALLADLTRGGGGLQGVTFTLDALHCKKNG